ncbi:hypothetical protein [Vibrio phage vB_VpM-pA2SJ1]|uniref:Uncharacterized protein n=1 Tax=Vibrio phage vB_VpM-pA2SJ1 TaxID=3095964 RepID=A0AAX4J603_9CAUD
MKLTDKQADLIRLIKERGFIRMDEAPRASASSLLRRGVIKLGPIYDKDNQAYIGEGLTLA